MKIQARFDKVDEFNLLQTYLIKCHKYINHQIIIILKDFKNYMYKYPQIISLIARNYPTQVTQLQQEIGRHYLKTLFYHTLLQYSIQLYSNFIIQNLEQILVKELNLNHEQILLMVITNKIFKEECQRSKSIIIETLKNVVIQYNKKEKEQEFKEKTNQTHTDDSFWQTQAQDQKIQDQKLIQQLKGQLQTKKQGQFIQNYVPIILTRPNPTQIPFNQEILGFIASLTSPKSQLSIFCQKFKIKFPQYKRDKDNDIYIVRGVLQIESYFTCYVPKLYEAESKFVNLKRAQNQVALQLLQKVWMDYPEIWKQYIKLKNQKN